MNNCNHNCVSLETPVINACTLPAGPKGNGIKSINQQENRLTVTYDNGEKQTFELPDWWFGTRSEYDNLTESEKREKSLYFIEEGT